MGSRPRLGSEGRVVLPAAVTVTRPAAPGEPGDVLAAFDDAGVFRVGEAGRGPTTDPFARRPDGLLLAESFARLDLRRPRIARAWFLENGVPDLGGFDREPDVRRGPDGRWWHRDGGRGVEFEQRQVAYYMGVVLAITRVLPPPSGEGLDWNPDEYPNVYGDPVGRPPGDDAPMARILFEVEADSIAAYVMRAMQPEIDPLGTRPPTGRPLYAGAPPHSFGPSVRLEWRSVIAPIYLQLYEALRRVSEGRPGARTCAECGQVFLVLDGRREKFCTNAEFARNRQRRYRERRRAS